MLNRRSFLLGAGMILAQFLAGCSQGNSLRVLLLQGSIPSQLIKKFSDSIKGKSIVFKPETKPQNFLDFLQEWQKQAKDEKPQQWQIPFFSKSIPPKTDLITLGDAWLASAIQQKLLKPIDPKELLNWQKLSPRWQELVRRNEKGEDDENGKIWGAPYRWGTTVIVYRKDKFQAEGLKEPTDWQDLWQEKLKNRISLLDQPRTVIGLTLKMLGYSFNTQDLAKIPGLEEKLKALHQNVKFYSSDYYLQPLVLGDTWLAVGWSNDVFPLLSRYSNLGVIIPPSGTALWADLWVKPSSAANSSTLEQWIDFCWQPESAYQITLFTNAASPIILTQPPEDLPEDIKNEPLLLVDEAILQKSDFILPISPKSQQDYDCLWKKVRRSAVQC